MKKILFWFLLICFVIGGGAIAIGLLINSTAGIVSGGILVLFGIMILILFHKAKKSKEKLEAEQNDKAEKLRQSTLQQLRDGTYPFPALEFYELCVKEGITSLDSSFYQNKLQLLLNSFLSEHFLLKGLTEEDYSPFFNDAAAVYRKGQEEQQRKIAVEQQRQATVQSGLIPPELKRDYRLQSEYLNLSGRDKRRKMLEDEVEFSRWRIDNLQKQADNISTLTDSLIASSQKKEQDWAVAGGLASGIAGGAAGVAAAMDTMAKNAEIRAQNAQAREHYSRMTAGAYGSTIQRRKYEEDHLKELQEELQQVESKVILTDKSSEELYGNLVVSGNLENASKTGPIAEGKPQEFNYLELTVKIINKNTANVPDNVQIVVDGYISAQLFANGQLMLKAPITLPTRGIRNGCSAELHYYFDKYVPRGDTYDVKFCDLKLWQMEA